MAQYKVHNPSIQKLKELAALAYNVRYWTIEFRGSNGKMGKLGVENRAKMDEAERQLDKWLKENTDVSESLSEENLEISE